MLVLILVAVFFFVTVAKTYFDTNYFKVNKIEFTSNKMPHCSEFTILQMSDLHNKVFRNNNEELIKMVKNLKANVIVLTGDIIDRRTKNLDNVLYLIERLSSINHKIFFVSGNHEWSNPRFKVFLKGLKERKVTILDNEKTKFTEGDVAINLVGVADYTTKHGDLKKALQGVHKERLTVLLSHSPSVIKLINSNSVDLILSGHTHGGQVRLPFIGALVVPDQGFFPKYDKGPFKLGNNLHLYIDSGLGTSRLPIRFLNQSQLSYIKITGTGGQV